MAKISPFRALRPRPEFAAEVAAPPYDVVTLEEARSVAAASANSFLRVSRAELELSEDADPYSAEVYARGAANLRKLIAEGVLVREHRPVLGVYRQRSGSHQQTGLVALASLDEYDHGLIRKHELTRPVKETDRVRIIETHASQSGPVLLFFRDRVALGNRLEDICHTVPDFQFTAADGVEHTVWSVRSESEISWMVERFRDVEALYIADGHHRSAAASRVRARQAAAGERPSSDRDDGFLAVIFPHEQLQILPYNRVVRDLNGMTPARFIEALSAEFDLQATASPGAPPPLGFDLYLDGRWLRAAPHPEGPHAAADDPVSSLPVWVLSERVLQPLLDISDQRSDSRIDFVGGVRGPDWLAATVDRGDWAAAFWLYPTSVEQLMAVSDSGRVMPPKSTWFEPKLRDGLFVHLLQ